jgi:hypothetical protein
MLRFSFVTTISLFQFQSRSLCEQLRNAAASEVGGAADLVEVERRRRR